MRILILGGTVFLGRALTDAAVAAGCDVTHFNRGKSGAEDPRVHTVRGDRTNEDDLAKVDAGWDVVIDTSGYLPQVVAKSAAALLRARRYIFVSTISVYTGPDFSETGALIPPPDPLPEERTPQNYGALKTACERVVRAAFRDRATIVRPGLIVGPDDPTDRFTYWPVRVARGGRVAAPGRPDRAVQFIDVRDLAAWIVKLARGDWHGTFNATGPLDRLEMGAFLETCRAVTGSDATFKWIDDAALERAGVAPWSEMPLFVPEAEPHAEAFMAVPFERAIATGLTFRPLGDTIRDTLAWARSRAPDHAWKAGLPPEKEAALLR